MDCTNRFSDTVNLFYRKGNNTNIVSIDKSLFLGYVFEKDDAKADEMLGQIAKTVFNDNKDVFENEAEARKYIADKFLKVILLRKNISQINFTDYEKLFAIANIYFLTGSTLDGENFNNPEYVRSIISSFIENISKKENVNSLFAERTFLSKIAENNNTLASVANLLSYSFMFESKVEGDKITYYKSYNNYQHLLRAIALEEERINNSKRKADGIRDLMKGLYAKDSILFFNALSPDILSNVEFAKKYSYVLSSYDSFFLGIDKNKMSREAEWRGEINNAVQKQVQGYMEIVPRENAEQIKNSINRKKEKIRDNTLILYNYGSAKKITLFDDISNTQQTIQEANIPVADTEQSKNTITAEALEHPLKEISSVLLEIQKTLSNIESALKGIYAGNPQGIGTNTTHLLSQLVNLIQSQVNNVVQTGNPTLLNAEGLIQAIDQTVAKADPNTIATVKEDINTIKRSLETYKGYAAPIILDENDAELALSEDSRYYIYKGIYYQRYTDVIEHYFDFEAYKPVNSVKQFFLNLHDEKYSSRIKTRALRILGRNTSLNNEQKERIVNYLSAAFNNLSEEMIDGICENVIKEYREALLEKRNFSFERVLNETYKVSTNERAAGRKNTTNKEAILEILYATMGQQSDSEVKAIAKEVEDLFFTLFEGLFSRYTYYTQRATLGRMTERIIQEKVKAYFTEGAFSEGQESTFATLTDEEVEAILRSYDNSATFYSSTSFINEFMNTDEYKRASNGYEKIQKLFEFLNNKEHALQEFINSYVEEELVLRDASEGVLSLISPKEMAVSDLEKIKRYKEGLTNTLAVLNGQYKEFANKLIKETEDAIKEWQAENITKQWDEVLLFNKKVLNRVIYEGGSKKVKEARLAGTPDVIIAKPNNQYKIYEIKSYINKSNRYRLNPKNTAKTGGYSLISKASFQTVSYISLMQGYLAVQPLQNITGEIVFFGNKSEDKDGNLKLNISVDYYSIPQNNHILNLFQKKILTRGVETFFLSDVSVEETPLSTDYISANLSLSIVGEKNRVSPIELSTIKEKLSTGEYELIIKDKAKHQTIYGKEIEGYGLYYKQAIDGTGTDNEEVFIGVLHGSNEQVEEILREIRSGNYEAINFSHGGARYILKTNKIEGNESMKVEEFVRKFMDDVAEFYGIDKENLHHRAVYSDPDSPSLYLEEDMAESFIHQEYNDLVIYYRDSEGVSHKLAKQRIYKPRMRTDGETTKRLLEAIETITNYHEATGTTSVGEALAKRKELGEGETDENLRKYIESINLFKRFLFNNLQVLRQQARAVTGNEDATIRDIGILMTYDKRDYIINFTDVTKKSQWYQIITRTLQDTKNQNTPYYEYEQWFSIRKDPETQIPYIVYENGLVRTSEFERDQNGKFVTGANTVRIFLDQKKKTEIERIRNRQKKIEYVINKSKEILNNFVSRSKKTGKTKIRSIYKDSVNIAKSVITEVPNYIMDVMETVRNKYMLEGENFVHFQDNLAQIIYVLDSLVYETRFGYTQEDDFVNKVSDIKNFEVVFDLIINDLIGQIDTWALSYFKGDELTDIKRELDILKFTIETLAEKRKKQEIILGTRKEVPDTSSEAVTTEFLEGETENDEGQRASDDTQEISTQQSIILGASSMTLEKNISKVIKNIIRYTAIKKEYRIKKSEKETLVIQTGKKAGRYIDFNIVYNSLPNFAGKRYYMTQEGIMYYYNPPDTIKDLAENIKSYLIVNARKKNDSFYLMMLAIYDKLFSDDNPNSLLNKAKENEDWESLLNGIFNALGSFTKTKYFVSNSETGTLDIRNLTGTPSYVKSTVYNLLNVPVVEEEIKDDEEAINFLLSLKVANGNKSLVEAIYHTAKSIFSMKHNVTEPNPESVIKALLQSEGFNQEVRNALSEIGDITESSVFKTLDGETRSDMGLRSTAIEDLQLLTTIRAYNSLAKSKRNKGKIDDEIYGKIKEIQESPHYKYNELVQEGIVDYGDYLGIIRKSGNIEYGKMDEEDIYFRFYVNVYKPLLELYTGSSKSVSNVIYINSFVSSNKKISFQAGVSHNISPASLKEMLAEQGEYNKLYDMLANKFFMRIQSELKARETLAKRKPELFKGDNMEVPFEFLAYNDEKGVKHFLRLSARKDSNGVLELSDSKEQVLLKIKEHFKKLVENQYKKVSGLLSGKYESMNEMLDNKALFALAIGLHRAYKWDLDTYLYGYANMEYKGIDKANKRASIHTSVKYKLNADTAFGIGKTFPVAKLSTPEKVMPELMMLGYGEKKEDTTYKPFDGAAFINPVFSELFARATGKNLGFGLTQQGAHKPVAMWRDRKNLRNISMKFASFDMFINQIDTESFFTLKKLLAVMLSKKVILEKKFYDSLNKREEAILDKVKKTGVITDVDLLNIPLSKLDYSLIADYYQAYNHYNSLIEQNADITEIKNPYAEGDIRYNVFEQLVRKEIASDLFSDIIAMTGDNEVFKNESPDTISFYDDNGKTKPLEAITKTGNSIIRYETKYFGFQLNPHHEVHKDTETPLATQLLYLISLYSTQNNSNDNNRVIAKKIYETLQNYIKNVDIENIIPYFVKKADGTISIDYIKFYKKVYEKSKADPSESLLFLNMVKEGKNPFSIPGIANKLISNVSSAVQNHIIRLKTLGTDFVLVPDFYTRKSIIVQDLSDKGNSIAYTSLKWHNLTYIANEDIEIVLDSTAPEKKLKIRKGEKVNVSEWNESVKLALVPFVRDKKLSLFSVGKCDLAMPVLDKGLLKEFLSVAKSLKELPEFDIYGKKGGIDNPTLYLELVKKRFSELVAGNEISEDNRAKYESIINRFERMISPLGVRIPTTSKGNSIIGQVVKFLDTDSNVVIFPSEIVKIHGSDYDVDKIKLFFKNYLSDKHLTDKEKAQHAITDQIVEAIEQILLDKENVYELFTDIDFGNAKNNIEIYSNALNTELVSKTIPYATLEGDAKLQTENMTNVYLVGIFATIAKFFSYASLAGIKLKRHGEAFSFNLDLPARERFIYRMNNGKFEKIPTDNNATYTKYVYSINAISIATNAAIDAVKEQIHGAIANNLFNARLYAFMLTQRNAFVSSAFFLSPLVHYEITYSFNEKKKDFISTMFDGLYNNSLHKTAAGDTRGYLLIEGDNENGTPKNKEAGVLSDITMFEVMQKGFNKSETDNFIAAIEELAKWVEKNSEAIQKETTDNVNKKHNFNNIYSKILEAIKKYLKDKPSNTDIREVIAHTVQENFSVPINAAQVSDNISLFINKFLEPIEAVFIDKSGTVTEKKQTTVGELSMALLEEYNDMVSSINLQLTKDSSVFGINQGYQRDLETNIERYMKALQLMANEEAYTNIEELFKDNHAGFFMTYHSKLKEAIDRLQDITIQASDFYLNEYIKFLKAIPYDEVVRKKAPMSYKRNFYRTINKIMLSPNSKIRVKDIEYDFTTDTGVSLFMSNFKKHFESIRPSNIFYIPLGSIVMDKNDYLRLSFNTYNSLRATQSLIHGIYDKMTSHLNDYASFFAALTDTETAYIKSHFKYQLPQLDPALSESERENILRNHEDEWQKNIFKELYSQYGEANDMYHAIFLYENMTNPGKEYMSVFNTLPSSLVTKIYGMLSDNISKLKTPDPNQVIVFMREMYMGMKVNGITEYENEQDTPYTFKNINGMSVLISNKEYPYAFKYTVYSPHQDEDVSHYIRLTDKEIEKLDIEKKEGEYYYAMVEKKRRITSGEETIDMRVPFENPQGFFETTTSVFKHLSLSDNIAETFGKIKHCR